MVSILIITYNRPLEVLDLLKCINRLGEGKNKDLIDEVLVLNNYSTVDYASVESYLGNGFRFKAVYIYSEENLGVAKGRNYLVGKAASGLLLFLDDDIYFEPFNPEQLLQINQDDFFRKNNTGILTFDIRYYENGQVQPSAFPHKNLEQKKEEAEFLTYFFTGAAHLIKKEVFENCGLYPADFFYGMEEYDLSYRAINRGYSLGYTKGITFLHKESPLGRKSKDEQYRMMWINKCKVVYRYLPLVYFFTTAFCWSFYYLWKSGFNIWGLLKGWRKIFSIPFEQKRAPLKRAALAYLKRVEGRLWY